MDLFFITDVIEYLNYQFGPGIFVPLTMGICVAVIGQWNLYVKCGQPGYACIIPVWNFIAFLNILGRPWWHMFLFFIPVYNIYLLIKVFIELCHCFNKYNILDYVAVILFNGIYVLYLGLSYDTEYAGPVYKMRKEAKLKKEGSGNTKKDKTQVA